MSYHHCGLAIAERVDKRDLVAQHVDRKERQRIRVERVVPAGGAAKATTVRSDRIVARGGQGRHHLAPAVGEVGKTVKQ